MISRERMFLPPRVQSGGRLYGTDKLYFGKVENGRFVSRAVSFETQKAEGEYELMVRPSAITLTVDETEKNVSDWKKLCLRGKQQKSC